MSNGVVNDHVPPFPWPLGRVCLVSSPSTASCNAPEISSCIGFKFFGIGKLLFSGHLPHVFEKSLVILRWEILS